MARICLDYKSVNGCKRGPQCLFSHACPQPCFDFIKDTCQYGAKCQYAHDAEERRKYLEPPVIEGDPSGRIVVGTDNPSNIAVCRAWADGRGCTRFDGSEPCILRHCGPGRFGKLSFEEALKFRGSEISHATRRPPPPPPPPSVAAASSARGSAHDVRADQFRSAASAASEPKPCFNWKLASGCWRMNAPGGCPLLHIGAGKSRPYDPDWKRGSKSGGGGGGDDDHHERRQQAEQQDQPPPTPSFNDPFFDAVRQEDVERRGEALRRDRSRSRSGRHDENNNRSSLVSFNNKRQCITFFGANPVCAPPPLLVRDGRPLMRPDDRAHKMMLLPPPILFDSF